MIGSILLANKKILVSSFAGFIVSNLVLALIEQGEPMTIVGLDIINDREDEREFRFG